jgi:hypothetical protein
MLLVLLSSLIEAFCIAVHFFSYLAKERNKLSEYKKLQQLAVFWAPIAIEPAFTGL